MKQWKSILIEFLFYVLVSAVAIYLVVLFVEHLG